MAQKPLHAPSVSPIAGREPLAGSTTTSESAVHLVRAGARARETLEFERAVVAFFVDAAQLLGIPKSVAAIYGICFANAEPLGFAEIHERLEISSGSISQGLKALREIGALRVVQSPNEKRDRFEPDLELKKLIRHYIDGRLEKQLNTGRLRLQAMEQVVPRDSGEESRILRPRLQSLSEWHDKTRALLPLVKSVLKLI